MTENPQNDYSFEILGFIRLHPLRFSLKDKLFTFVWFTFSIFAGVTCCIGLADIYVDNVKLIAMKVQGIMTHVQVK